MQIRSWPTTALILLATLGGAFVPLASSESSAQDDNLRSLDGEWLYVEDRTEGRAIEDQGPRMSPKFALRVEKDAVIYPRPRGDERITLDGSVIEKDGGNDSVTRYSGTWKDGALEYMFRRVRPSDDHLYLRIRREFRVTSEGLLVSVSTNDGAVSVSLYQHPEDIELPEPAKATIVDMDWLAGAWVGKKDTSFDEEHWTPSRGGAMLGVSRTVKSDKMRGFEFLRIVERDGGLVYFAQPGGRTATEFVLTKLEERHAEFVNPRHDYPQRIIYELSDEGVMTASIGMAKGGSPRGNEYIRENK